MHTCVIVLLTAHNRREAVKKVGEFLTNYKDDHIYDQYTIGGEWSGLFTRHLQGDHPAKLEISAGTDRTLKEDRVHHDGDVMPLHYVKEKVCKILGDWPNERMKFINELIAFLERSDDSPMLDYCRQQKKQILGDCFTWDSVVYDAERQSNNVPDSTDGYWAVVLELNS